MVFDRLKELISYTFSIQSQLDILQYNNAHLLTQTAPWNVKSVTKTFCHPYYYHISDICLILLIQWVFLFILHPRHEKSSFLIEKISNTVLYVKKHILVIEKCHLLTHKEFPDIDTVGIMYQFSFHLHILTSFATDSWKKCSIV